MDTQRSTHESLVDPRDRTFVSGLEEGEHRDTVVASLARHRKPERLEVGDPLPALDLLRLEDGGGVGLRSLLDGRPLVLVFGSFT